MKKKSILSIFFTIVFLGLSINSVYAACIYEGVSYPTGTTVGELTCQPDGTWR